MYLCIFRKHHKSKRSRHEKPERERHGDRRHGDRGGESKLELEIREANELRAKLGMAPLE